MPGLPAPADVRKLLEGYAIDTKASRVLTGTLTLGSAIVTGIDTTLLNDLMYVSGVGVPPGAQVLSVGVVDPAAGTISLSAAATANGPQSLTFTYYSVLTDSWLANAMANVVAPLVTNWCRQNFNAIETVVEYYDGTGSSILVLRRRPIVALLNLSYTNVDSNLYYLSPSAMQVIADEGILKAKANFNESTYTPIFWKGQRNLRVTYQVGWATCPNDAAEAIKRFTAEMGLGLIADRTGGGSLSVQSFSRDFGKRGRYTNIRNTLAREGYALIRKYMTGVSP